MDLEKTELGRALNAAGIEYSITNTRQHVPQFEYFDDDFVFNHSEDWATIDQFMVTTPRFVNVRVKDYVLAMDLMIDEQGS